MHISYVSIMLTVTLGIVLTFFGNAANGKDWWETANFYQIYPRSFRDSDGDGIGDLNGISEKLQYLKDVGITAAWLSPIFKSPMVDFGYDIADFYQVDPVFGTMEDFEHMMVTARKVGVKIILDFVPNHSSDQGEWFKKSVNGDPQYKDYFVWHPGKINATTGERTPPSNWLSRFRYSAWEWNDIRQAYYLHQFTIQQPDLNYRNPGLVNEMKNVMLFWLEKGISGFRIDAVPFLFEADLDRYNNYPDEPVSATDECPDPDDWCHLSHVFTQDLPETLDMVYQWRELVDQFKAEHGGDTRVLLTEAYTDFDVVMLYYGDGKRNGSEVPFNFDLLTYLQNDTNAPTVVDHINKWMASMPRDGTANWVLGNHDNHRLSSRLGVARIDLFNIMLQTLPGIAVTYYGEEIGMSDVYIGWEDTVDPEACNSDPDHYYSITRDPARTPFQWDASKNAGFTTGDQTWLPVSDDYKQNNVLQQSRTPRSHLQIFKKLTRLRKQPSFQAGELKIHAIDEDIIIYSRQKADSALYIVVLNLGSQNKTIDINQYHNMGNQAEIITTSIHSQNVDGDLVDPKTFIAEAQVGSVLVVVN